MIAIFGTGDKHFMQTVTTDHAFYDAAKFRGVVLDIQPFVSASYSGK